MTERLERRADRVDRAADRFDDFESCLSWVPLTEYGDPDGEFGFARLRNGSADGFGAGNAVDISEWDDPDYMVLALAGNDDPERPGQCDSEPGEGVDRIPPGGLGRSVRSEAIEDLDSDVGGLLERVEDLGEPVDEFEMFDQCAFLIGITEYGSRNGATGFVYRRGTASQRPLLAMDLAGFDPAEHYFLAFPGEEPPQIECNEDASTGGTEE